MTTRQTPARLTALLLLALSVVASVSLSLGTAAGALTRGLGPQSFSPKLLSWETSLLLDHSTHVGLVLDTSAGFESASIDRGVVQSDAHGVLTLLRADKATVAATLTHATKFEGITRGAIVPGDHLAVVSLAGAATTVRNEENGVPAKFLSWETKLLLDHCVHATLLVKTSDGYVTAAIDHGIVQSDVAGVLGLEQAGGGYVSADITKATRFAGIAKSKIVPGDHLVVVQETGDAVLVARSPAATPMAPLG